MQREHLQFREAPIDVKVEGGGAVAVGLAEGGSSPLTFFFQHSPTNVCAFGLQSTKIAQNCSLRCRCRRTMKCVPFTIKAATSVADGIPCRFPSAPHLLKMVPIGVAAIVGWSRLDNRGDPTEVWQFPRALI
ncbi:hypothetical protein ACQJBY_068024 [Aegilops geniculata]